MTDWDKKEAKGNGEDYFYIDSKPIEVCRVARGKRCKMEPSCSVHSVNTAFTKFKK